MSLNLQKQLYVMSFVALEPTKTCRMLLSTLSNLSSNLITRLVYHKQCWPNRSQLALVKISFNHNELRLHRHITEPPSLSIAAASVEVVLILGTLEGVLTSRCRRTFKSIHPLSLGIGFSWITFTPDSETHLCSALQTYIL